MRDYTFELLGEDDYGEKHADFILNYDVYRDLKLIKVYYADGKCITMDYNFDNEKYLLEKMREQVLAYKSIMLNAKERNIENEKEIGLNLFNFGIVALGCTLLLIKDIPIKVFGSLFFIGGSCLTILDAYAKFSIDYDFDDFDKNLLFIENENRIQEAIGKDQEFLLDLPIRILKGITCNAEGKIGFSINSISKLRYRDIESLLAIIDDNKDGMKFSKKR